MGKKRGVEGEEIKESAAEKTARLGD